MNDVGIERWKDDSYRKAYRFILNGTDLEKYDPFEVDYRGRGDSTFLR
jgi:hypothetical protein